MSVPHNVLSVVYRHADARTKARLRAASRATLRDPLMPQPLRRGYAYGTGKYQKAYNELSKRLSTLSTRCVGVSMKYEVGVLKQLVDDVKKLYQKSSSSSLVFSHDSFRKNPGLYDIFDRLTVDREQAMDRVLEYGERKMREYQAHMAPCLTASDANVSRMKARTAIQMKGWRKDRQRPLWDWGLEGDREEARAVKIARRAARSMAT